MTDTNKQTPATLNQITNEKPRIEKTAQTIRGTIGGSLNAAHNKTIAWARIMAGQKIESYSLPIQLKMLTPLTPPYGQELIGTARFYFVPDSRVFKNSEKFYAQQGGSSKVKLTKKPSFAGKKIPFIQWGDQQGDTVCLTETTLWRDTMISSYIPRVGYFNFYNEQETPWANKGPTGGATMPEYDACLVRGRIAIYNDFERNKQYDSAWQEYNGDTVTDTEWKSYLPIDGQKLHSLMMRSRRNNSYYTDYRVEAQGYETDPISVLGNPDEQNMLDWSNYEAQLDELRQQAENAERNPWDIMHEIYGTTRKLSEGKVQLLKTFNFNMNYAHVTQNAYNTNETIKPEYQVLGQQGAYSYTEVVLEGPKYWEAIEPGYIHVILTVSATTVFERAFERTAMNVNWDDEYRPSLKDQKLDTLNYLEVETALGADGTIGGNIGPIGFKRKWNEYGKLPNCINADMTSKGYYQANIAEGNPVASVTEVLSQGTHQFYEENALGAKTLFFFDEAEDLFTKQYHLDYSDLLINKNQAIKNTVEWIDASQISDDIIIEGQQQIFYGGKQIMKTILPISEDVITNFTKWGEH